MLTIEDAVESPLKALIIGDKLLQLMQNVALAIFVLYVKLSSKDESSIYSKWAPYMNILPSQFHTPLYFNLDDLDLLKPAQCFCKTLI